ncbi:hypothetical protein ASC77_21350 [Nocardioides sp. Root1257]|uniref:hypothetical protein n=1 Tax=unclassified Nocardioides TaxID=2615069 RepID=UPI000701A943|nr:MULTISPECIES: hypothetical protein [unclassified Nocardioides]KQW43943.1 hypothetical protein ASC77_21350 [Nocardioides sp. Root1257]KRC42384.1 hypothetical protein ASE24_21145 [Nocardioides sp. Root224]
MTSRTAGGENRLPPGAAVVVAIVVYALLPSSVLLTNRLIIPVVEVLLLVALVVTNPRRITRETRWSRWVSMALASVVILTNLGSLVLLVTELTGSTPSGSKLLAAAMQIWLTNVIGFALLYWELDRGGPVARRSEKRTELPDADWRFSQDENDDTVVEVSRGSSKSSGWVPIFVDYLYLSLTNSSAFSPTDTMPLTSRAKVLMGIQATAALLTSLVLVAFAVGSLGG